MCQSLLELSQSTLPDGFTAYYGIHTVYINTQYTGSRSVQLDIFMTLTYFVESIGRDKIQRLVKLAVLVTK